MSSHEENSICKEKWIQSTFNTEFGRCSYYHAPGYIPCIYGLYVEKAHRRRGHARMLLRTVVAEIRESGYAGDINIEAVPTEHSISSKKLVAFYESEGLTVIGVFDEEA